MVACSPAGFLFCLHRDRSPKDHGPKPTPRRHGNWWRRRIEEAQRRIESIGPCGLGVRGAIIFQILKIVVEAPAFLEQAVAQEPCAFPTRLVRAGIEPDFER